MVAERSVPVAASLWDAVDFGTVFEHAPGPLAVIRAHAGEMVVLAANPAMLDRLGLSASEISGRRLEKVLAAEPAAVLGQAVQKAVETGGPVEASLPALGSARPCEITAELLEPEGALVLVSAGLPEVRAQLTSIVTLDQLEALGEGLIFIVDLARRRARYLAPELARRIGHPMEAVLDLETARALVHPDDFEAVAACFSGSGPPGGAGVSGVTLRMRRPEGGWRWLDVRCRALAADRHGKAQTVLGVAVDVTERRAMSRALDRAARAVLRAGEQERRRIARNLHDSTAQHLVALDLSLSSLERRLAPVEATAAILRDMRESLAAAHREIRTYSYLLHPPQLQRLGLEATLRRFVEGFGRRSGLAVEMEASGPPLALGAELELALFRVAQEAIMNVHRHAQASRVRVRLARTADRIVLEVEDDGIGLGDPEAFARACEDGVGIPGMQARMAQIGGALELISLPRGLCVRAEAPVQG